MSNENKHMNPPSRPRDVKVAQTNLKRGGRGAFSQEKCLSLSLFDFILIVVIILVLILVGFFFNLQSCGISDLLSLENGAGRGESDNCYNKDRIEPNPIQSSPIPFHFINKNQGGGRDVNPNNHNKKQKIIKLPSPLGGLIHSRASACLNFFHCESFFSTPETFQVAFCSPESNGDYKTRNATGEKECL
jgi:hypothetical protein